MCTLIYSRYTILYLCAHTIHDRMIHGRNCKRMSLNHKYCPYCCISFQVNPGGQLNTLDWTAIQGHTVGMYHVTFNYKENLPAAGKCRHWRSVILCHKGNLEVFKRKKIPRFFFKDSLDFFCQATAVCYIAAGAATLYSYCCSRFRVHVRA